VPTDPAWWSAELFDVTTLPDGTAWACGQFQTYDGFSSIETFTLAEFWDGQQWTHVPTPSPSAYPGGTQAILSGIDAVAPDDVWAGGERRGDAGGLSVGAWIMVQHWDGSSWELVDVPEPPGGVSINFSGPRIHDVLALAEDDVWFGGQWGEPNAHGSVTWRPLAMHWDGSGMEIFDTPVVYENYYGFALHRMSAVAPDDIWAVCRRLTAGGHSQQLVVLHFDGDSWELEPVPNPGSMSVMYTVEALASDDVWIFGEEQWPAGPEDIFTLHYDGSGWTAMTDGPPARGSFALAPDAIYTGAGYNIGHGAYLFDGDQHVQVEDFPGLNAHVFEGHRGPGCAGWLVGREMVGGKKPFAALLGSSGGSQSGGGTGGMQTAAGTPLRAQGKSLVLGVGAGSSGGSGGGTAVTLAGAEPGARALLAIGTEPPRALRALRSGALVPAPELLAPAPRADHEGTWTIEPSALRGLPAGTEVWLQAWVPDSTAPGGWRASRAVPHRVP
jgi:hypothetical protein